VETLAEELYSLPYEPYAPVRKQLLKLFHLINAKRQAAGYSKVPVTALRMRREIVRAFEAPRLPYRKSIEAASWDGKGA
jgi:hypothetical protein